MLYIHTINAGIHHQVEHLSCALLLRRVITLHNNNYNSHSDKLKQDELAFSRRWTGNIPDTRFLLAHMNLTLQKPHAERGIESVMSVSFDRDFGEKRSSVVRGDFLQGLQQSLFDFFPVWSGEVGLELKQGWNVPLTVEERRKEH